MFISMKTFKTLLVIPSQGNTIITIKLCTVSVGFVHEMKISSFSHPSAQPKIFDGASRETVLGLEVLPKLFLTVLTYRTIKVKVIL